MNRDEKRVVLLEHRAQLWSDALWQKNRNPGADPHELDVRDGAQTRQDPVQSVIWKQQWIAAGEQHVADLRSAFQIAKCRFPLGFQVLFTDAGNHP